MNSSCLYNASWTFSRTQAPRIRWISWQLTSTLSACWTVTFPMVSPFLIRLLLCCWRLWLEVALSQLEAVQARLAQNEHELQQQIAELHLELRRDQDPNRMQLIQEMISVFKVVCSPCLLCWHSFHVVGSTGTNLSNTRESDGVRGCSPEYHERDPSPWPR